MGLKPNQKRKISKKVKMGIISLVILLGTIIILSISQTMANFTVTNEAIIIDGYVGRISTTTTVTFMANEATLSTPEGCINDEDNRICKWWYKRCDK